MTARGFAVAVFKDATSEATSDAAGDVSNGAGNAAQWRLEPLPPTVLEDLGVLLAALRSQPPEGGPFVIACVEDEFFVIARQEGRRIALLLSDLTAAVEFPLAEQAITRLGEDPPNDDELDEVWPVGDLELFDDLHLGEEEMEEILDDLDALPEEMLDTIIERLELTEAYSRATDAAWVR